MNHFLHTKSNSQRFLIFILIASLLAIVWGLIGYYVISGVYFIICFLFYIAIFLLGMYFKLPNINFIPFAYILTYSSDLVTRILKQPDKKINDLLFFFLVFYTLELTVLTLKKLSMDAKDYGWSTKQRWQNIGIALLLPSIALVVYYIIIRQVFVFE